MFYDTPDKWGPSTQGPGHRPRIPAPRHRPRTQNPGRGTRDTGPRTQEPGPRTQVSGHRARNLSTRNQDPGPGTQVPILRTQDPVSRTHFIILFLFSCNAKCPCICALIVVQVLYPTCRDLYTFAKPHVKSFQQFYDIKRSISGSGYPGKS